MTTPNNDTDYWLNRDFIESARLSFQHQCLMRRQGYFIHPSITSATGLSGASENETAPEHIEIADIGTGNGIWTVETCASLDATGRSYKMIGLDISDAQFPPERSWPKHCTFDTWDIFSEVPEKYIGKFDIVHVRLITAALSFKPAEARDQALRNMTKLVKPGGWFQWQEPLPVVFPEVTIHEDGSCSFKEGLHGPQTVAQKHVPDMGWLSDLADFVKDVAGFEQTRAYYPPPKREYFKYESDLFAWNWKESLAGMARVGALNQEALAEANAAWDEYAADLRSGKMVVAMQTSIVVGRKPVDAAA